MSEKFYPTTDDERDDRMYGNPSPVPPNPLTQLRDQGMMTAEVERYLRIKAEAQVEPHDDDWTCGHISATNAADPALTSLAAALLEKDEEKQAYKATLCNVLADPSTSVAWKRAIRGCLAAYDRAHEDKETP
jgi:hypothetical protein